MAIPADLQRLLNNAKNAMPVPLQTGAGFSAPTQSGPTIPSVPNIDFSGLSQPLISSPVPNVSFGTPAFDLPNINPGSIDIGKGVTDVELEESRNKLGYQSSTELRQDINATKEAAAGNGLVGLGLGALGALYDFGVDAITYPGRKILGAINPKFNTDIGMETNPFVPLVAKNIEYNKKNLNKLEETIGSTGFRALEKKQDENSKFIADLVGTEYTPLYANVGGEGSKNLSNLIAKETSNKQNMLLPYLEARQSRENQLRRYGRYEEADLYNDITQSNIRQLIKNDAELIKIKSEVQVRDESQRDNIAARAAQAKVKELGFENVNEYRLKGLKDEDGNELNVGPNKTLNEGGLPTANVSSLMTAEDLFNNQANDSDADTIAETSTNPYKILYSQFNKYYDRIPQGVSRGVFGQLEDAAGMQFAAADFGYAPSLGYSEREKSSIDNLGEVTNEILDVLPEFATSLGSIRATAPLQSVNILKGAKIQQQANSLLKVSKAVPVVNLLKGVGKLGLAETIFNGTIDSFNQAVNSPTNYMANTIGFFLGSLPEIATVGKQWSKIMSYDELGGLLRDNALSNVASDLATKGYTPEQIQNTIKNIPDEALVGQKINPEYIDARVDEIDAALQIDSSIKDANSKKIADTKKKLRDAQADSTTEPAVIEDLQNELKLNLNEQKQYNDHVNFQIAQQASIRKFLTNPTSTGATEMAQIIKTYLPNTGQTKLRSELLDLVSRNPGQVLDDVKNVALSPSLVSSDNGYSLIQAKNSGLDVGRGYNDSQLNDIVNKSKNQQTLKWIAEENDDGTLKYFSKVDGRNYMLNDEGLRKLNLVEDNGYVAAGRTLGSASEGTEQSRFIDEVAPKMNIPQEEIDQIANGNIYTDLLDEVNDFIPCII